MRCLTRVSFEQINKKETRKPSTGGSGALSMMRNRMRR